MEEELNIANILKDKPSGTKLLENLVLNVLKLMKLIVFILKVISYFVFFIVMENLLKMENLS